MGNGRRGAITISVFLLLISALPISGVSGNPDNGIYDQSDVGLSQDTVSYEKCGNGLILQGTGILRLKEQYDLGRIEFRGFEEVLIDQANVGSSEGLKMISDSPLELRDSTIVSGEMIIEAPSIKIDGCQIYGGSIWYTTVTGDIRNSTFSKSFLMLSSTGRQLIDNNTFNMSRIDTTGGSYVNITNNLFINGNSSIFAGASQGVLTKLTVIENNTFENCKGIGFHHSQTSPLGPQYISDVHVRFNSFKNCTRTMYFATNTYGQNIRISRNWFYHNMGTGDNGSGMQIGPYNWYHVGIFDILFHEMGLGNCWQNHRSPDSDRDGIVDIPYGMSDDSRTVKDLYPLTSPYYGILAPEVKITSPANGTKTMRNVTVNWTIDDHGVPIKRIDLIFEDNGTTLNVSGKDHVMITLGLGSNNISIMAEDAAGMKDSDSITIETLYSNDMANIIEHSGWETNNDVMIEWEIDQRIPVSYQQLSIDDTMIIPLPSDVRQKEVYLRDGYHEIGILVRESHGWEFMDSINIKVDTKEPMIDLLSPKDNAIMTNQLMRFRWRVEDEMALSSVRSRIDGKEWIIHEEAYISFDELQGHGSHKLEIEAEDEAGWISLIESNYFIGTGSNVCILEPQDNLITSSRTVHIEWIEPEGFDVEWTELYTMKTQRSINVTDLREYTLALESLGRNEVHLIFHDRHGNYFDDELLIFLDKVDPFVGFENIKPFINTSSCSIIWNGYDQYGIGGYQYKLDQEEWSNLSLMNMAHYDGLDEGRHTFWVKAVDMAGNTAIDIWEFEVDTRAPVIDLASPADGGKVKGPEVSINWDVRDQNLVDLVNVTMENNSTYHPKVGEIIFNLESGFHTLIVTCSDLAGNIGMEKRIFLLDNYDPKLEWNMDTPLMTMDREIELKWIEEDDTGVVSRSLMVNGVEREIGDQGEHHLVLSDGRNLIELSVTDALDRETTITWELFVDREPPEMVDLKYIEKDKGFDVEGSFRDSISGFLYIDLFINGDLVRIFTDKVSYHHEVNIFGLINITAVVRDQVGNQQSFSILAVRQQEKEEPDRGNEWLILFIIIIMINILVISLLLIKIRIRRSSDPTDMEKMKKRMISSRKELLDGKRTAPMLEKGKYISGESVLPPAALNGSDNGLD